MAIKPKTIKVTVGSAGTAVAISAAILYSAEILMEVPSSNTGGIIGPGSSDVAATNADVTVVGSNKELSAPANGPGQEIDLSETYIDAENDGDVAYITYWVKV